jgi:Flp pilus assembly protein TadG
VRNKRNERGAAVVEFAIVLPILLLVLLSVVDFGRYFYARVSLSSASFEVADAVARGLISESDDESTKTSKILAVINDISPGIASFSQLTSSATLLLNPLPTPCPNSTNMTTAEISSQFNSISPLKTFFTEVSGKTSMRCLR